MTVYIDQLLALNTLVNYLLLSAAGRLGGEAATRPRRLAGAALGACYALVVLLPGWRVWGMLSLKLLCAAAMTAAAFGLSPRLPRQWLLVLALSALYGGAVLAVETLLGGAVTMINGAAYYPVSFRTLVLTAGGVWLLFATVLARLGAHSGGDLAALTLSLDGRSTTVQALRDTGNSLCDPISGLPVPVVELGRAAASAPCRSGAAAGRPHRRAGDSADLLPVPAAAAAALPCRRRHGDAARPAL